MQALSDLTPAAWVAVHLLALSVAWSTRLHLGSLATLLAHGAFVIVFSAVATCAVMAFSQQLQFWVLAGSTMGVMLVAAVCDFHCDSDEAMVALANRDE